MTRPSHRIGPDRSAGRVLARTLPDPVLAPTLVPALVLAWVLVCPMPASAATWVVRADGTGDFPTIQQAVTAGAAGDVIELADGTFTGDGNRNIVVPNRTLTIRSQGMNPDFCVIDCEYAGQGFVFGFPPAGTSLQGITITRGSAEELGGGLEAGHSSSPAEFLVADCVFLRNRADAGGGAHASGRSRFVRCRFVENEAHAGGAFISGAMSGNQINATFEECVFLGNTATYEGAAIELEAVPMRTAGERHGVFTRCLFAGNIATAGRAIFHVIGVSPTIDACTFVDNVAPGGAAIACATIDSYPGSNPVIHRSIIAFTAGGAAVTCEEGSQPVLSCSDLFGNDGGDWIGCIADQFGQGGNRGADPLFCDRPHGDYTIQTDSPCAPPQNPGCGLIGALPVACGDPTPVRSLRWGQIKWEYRGHPKGEVPAAGTAPARR